MYKLAYDKLILAWKYDLCYEYVEIYKMDYEQFTVLVYKCKKG